MKNHNSSSQAKFQP